MASRLVRDDAPVASDPACVPDIFIEGPATFEWLPGLCLRISLYRTKTLGDGATEREIVVRLVMSVIIFPNFVRQLLAFLTGEPVLSDTAKPPDVLPH